MNSFRFLNKNFFYFSHEHPYKMTVHSDFDTKHEYITKEINIHPNYDVLSGSHNLAIVDLVRDYSSSMYFSSNAIRTCLPDQVEEMEYMACYTLGVVQADFGKINIPSIMK